MRHPGARVLLVGVLLAACHTITEDLPESEAPANPVAPVPIPVVVQPVPIPSPQAPNPTPTPANPAPQPTPTPGPTPPPPSATCSPGTGTGSGSQCQRSSPQFLGDVDAAIDRLVEQHPELFDLRDQQGAGGYLVLDPIRYHDGVVANLRAAGFCAQVFSYEEIAVKRDNTFGEGYDILLSTNHIRRGEGSYRGTCAPAWF
jgi:hypothetical protein